MKKLPFILLAAASMLLFSCSKDRSESDKNDLHTLEEIDVPDDFNWRTYTHVDFELKGGFNSLIEVASTNGKTVYHRGYLVKDQTLSISVPIPSFETRVIIRYMGKAVTVDLAGSVIVQEF